MTIRKYVALGVTLLLSISVPTVQAHSDANGVIDALNELNYSLSVVWDQKDMAFMRKAQEKFRTKIAEAIRSGLTVDEVFDTIAASSLSAQSKQDLGVIKDLVKAGQLSEAEGQQQALNYIQSAQARGVLFSTGAVLVSSVILIAVVVAIVASGGVKVITAPPCPNVDPVTGVVYPGICP